MNPNYTPDLSVVRNYPNLIRPVEGVGSWLDDVAINVWGGGSTTREVQAAQTALANKRGRTDLDTKFPIMDSSDGNITDAFIAGAKEGWAAEKALPGKVVGFIGDSAGDIGGGVLKNIPWWVWAGLFTYAAVQTYPYWRGLVKTS
jgi:hypothetical protein